jgi:hypothetical protein
MNSADYWIKKLDLKAHPEGGFYKETYRSPVMTRASNGKSRNLSTSIYFLLNQNDRSHFHRLRSDELWYYHLGSPVRIFELIDGALETTMMGPEEGMQLQKLIPHGSIFAAEVVDKDRFSLFGCLVSPGFDFEDFELMTSSDLISEYPEHSNLIKAFTAR